MFDWEKYNKEMLKRNHKYILLFFLVWVIYTAGFGLALAHVQGTAYLIAGAVAYIISCFGFKNMGSYWNLKERLSYHCKLLKECIEGFVKKKGLEKEFKEFSGSEL